MQSKQMKMHALAASLLLAFAPVVFGQAAGGPIDTEVRKLDSASQNHGQALVAQKIASNFTKLAGSERNALELVNALRDGSTATLTTTVPGTDGGASTTTESTITPATGKMGWGNVKIALALAQDTLARAGVTSPTTEQLDAALNGGDITVTGSDGKAYVSDQATIWRWRTAFQHEFAARMDWTIKPYAAANHNPLVTVNGKDGTAPIIIEAQVGEPITLDAGRSHDPDGHKLRYQWFHYAEAGFVPGANMAAVTISQGNAAKVTVTVTAACREGWRPMNRPCPTGVAHIILAVTDNGLPALTSYRRVILNVRSAGNRP